MPVRGGGNRRKRRRFSAEERRHQLLKTAVGLFSRLGFEGTTTKAIAAAAGVSEGIIFQHFATKEELYASILDYKAKESGIEEWEKQLQDHARQENDEALIFSLVERILQSDRRDPQFMRLMLQAALKGKHMPKIMAERILPFHRFLSGYIEKRQSKGAFRECDPAAAVHAIVSMPSHYGLAARLFGLNTIKMPEHEMAATFTRLILGGLRAPEAPPRKRMKTADREEARRQKG